MSPRLPFRRARMLGAVLVAVPLALSGGSATAAPKPARPAAASPPPRTFGLITAHAPGDLSETASLTSRLGVAPTQLTWYVAWSTGTDFPVADATRVAATGAVPEITWEPWDPAGGVAQPAYALDRIASGGHDAYLRRWATQVKAYARPVVLRFAHEMNGSWYPWAEQVNGNSAGDYVAAWRHVVGVFQRAKATNVTWSWAPNVPYPGSTPLHSLYPGDSVVQRVALDGYNWGTSRTWSTWQSFGDLFGPGVAEVRVITSRPLHVAETGSSELGGDKAAWVADAWAWLGAHPEVRGVTWFSVAKETDWRLDSSAGALDAFAAGLPGFVGS